MESTMHPEISEPGLPSDEVPDSSSQIEVPARLIDQVIGQEHAVEVIEKAAIQRRHVMMIGSPGTGKSMTSLYTPTLTTLITRLSGPCLREGENRSSPHTRQKPGRRYSSAIP
jgi:Holliday junction resolvasome RuvABC ATP-dependent DNA helicase subunit